MNPPADPELQRWSPPSDKPATPWGETFRAAPRCRAAAHKGLICILLFCHCRSRPTRGALSWDGAGFGVSCVNCIFGCSALRLLSAPRLTLLMFLPVVRQLIFITHRLTTHLQLLLLLLLLFPYSSSPLTSHERQTGGAAALPVDQIFFPSSVWILIVVADRLAVSQRSRPASPCTAFLMLTFIIHYNEKEGERESPFLL